MTNSDILWIAFSSGELTAEGVAKVARENGFNEEQVRAAVAYAEYRNFEPDSEA